MVTKEQSQSIIIANSFKPRKKMFPISPQNYRGITYIHLDNLPLDQQSQIGKWIPAIEFIKIKIADDIIEHCMNYQDYIYWYENFYSLQKDYDSEI